MADDQLSALFAEPTDAPEGSEPHDDPTKPESEPPAEPAEPKADPGAEPKEPEPGAEPKEDEDGEPAADRQGNVSFQALQRERDKRREIQAKLDAQQAMIQRIEGRFAQFQLQQQPPPPPQQQPQRPPTVDEDPIAVLRQVNEANQQQIAAVQQAKARKEFEGHIAGFEAQFRPQAPDYDDAAIFLAQRRDQDLIDSGYHDPEERKEIMYRDMATLAVNAVQRGINPAQVAYNMAKRWGYQPQGQQAQGQQAQGQQAQQDAPPRAPNGQFQAAEQKLEMAERGQQASRSLSAGGGRAPPGLTVEALDAMSDDDFWQVAHDEKKWRKVWGADQ
jgi:hypothetical protein